MWCHRFHCQEICGWDQFCILSRMKKSMTLFHIRIFPCHFALFLKRKFQHVGHKWVIYVTIWAKTRYVCIQTDIHFIAQVIATLNNYMHTTLETLPFVYFCFFILAGLCHYPSHPHTLPTHCHIYTGPILLIHSIKNHQKLPGWKLAIILFARLVLQKIINRSLSIVMLSSYICKRVQYQGKDGVLRLNCHFLKYWQVQTWLVFTQTVAYGSRPDCSVGQ